jgi:hypothetical protein
MPSTMAKVMRHSAKEACCGLHHHQILEHLALVPMAGIVSVTLKR